MELTNGKSLSIKSDQINDELTSKLQKQEKYINFNKWLVKNGVISNGVQYPVAFGEDGIIGAAAIAEIAPLTAFISIPNKVIISYDKARFSELKSIFKQNKDLFCEKENDEAGINILTVFLMFERLKGPKSFWHEYFEIVQNPETILTWSDKEIESISDSYSQKQAKEYKDSVKELWKELKAVLIAYSHIFAKSSVTKELFLWAYNTVMSRCFGYTEQGTCLVPFADCLNHSKYHATYFYVQHEFELNTKQKHAQYNLKKNTIDLSIIDPRLANKKTPPLCSNEIFSYVKQFKEDSIFSEASVRSQLMPTVREINKTRLEQDSTQCKNKFLFSKLRNMQGQIDG